MMHSKRRSIPVEVSAWTQKDTHIRRPTINPGLMPKDTRFQILARRKFYDDLLKLSFERHRKIARCDLNRKTFLKKQQQKAEKRMPSLLPYFKPFQEEIDEVSLSSFTSSRSDSLMSPSRQSMKSSWLVKSEASFRPLSKVVTVEDLVGDVSPKLNHQSFLPKISQRSSKDRRFEELVCLFSDVYKRKSPLNQSVQTIVQSKTSLQKPPNSLRKTNLQTLHFTEEDKLNESFDVKTDVSLIDSSVCQNL